MGVLKLKDGNNWTSIQTIKGEKGDTGERGQAGVGVPSGGTTGQVLKKASGTDYDTEWGSAGSSLPSGGTQGQVLTKNSSTDGDASWVNAESSNFVITLTSTNGSTHTMDKTYQEIYNAYTSGKTLELRFKDLGQSTPIVSTQYKYDSGSREHFTFFIPVYVSNDLLKTKVIYIYTSTISVTQNDVIDGTPCVKYYAFYDSENNNTLSINGIGEDIYNDFNDNKVGDVLVYMDVDDISYKKLGSIVATEPVKDSEDEDIVVGFNIYLSTIENNTFVVKKFYGNFQDDYTVFVENVSPSSGGSLPSGGTAGQVLTKNSSTDGDADWSDPVISDVQVNGTSVVSNGIANVPHDKIIFASTTTGASTAVKVLTCNWYPDTIEDGTFMVLYSSVTNTASNAKFKFSSGDTGEYYAYANGNVTDSTTAALVGLGGYYIPFIFKRTNSGGVNIGSWYSLYGTANASLYGLLEPNLWSKIRLYTNVLFGTCSTAAATATKAITVTAPKWANISQGTILFVSFSYTNTASSVKFQLSYYTGATNTYSTSTVYDVKYNNSTIGSGTYYYGGVANRIGMYVWYNSYWHWVGWSYETDTTYSVMTQSEADTGTATNARLITPKVLHDTIMNSSQTVLLDVVDETVGSSVQQRIYQYPSQIKSLIEDGYKFFVNYSFSIYPARASVVVEWNETAQDYLTKVVVSFDQYNWDNNIIETYVLSSYINEENPGYEDELSGSGAPVVKTPTADTIPYDNTETYSSGSIGEAVKNIESDVETLKDGLTFIKYGISTWDDFITAYNNNNVVYCRASSGSNPASGSQTRLAFMAYVNSAETPTEVEFQYYRSVSSHTAQQQGDQVFVYKLNKTGGWTVTTREAYTKIVAGTGLTSTYSNGVLTISLA